VESSLAQLAAQAPTSKIQQIQVALSAGLTAIPVILQVAPTVLWDSRLFWESARIVTNAKISQAQTLIVSTATSPVLQPQAAKHANPGTTSIVKGAASPVPQPV